MIKHIFFDLDQTLLDFDMKEFLDKFVFEIVEYLTAKGYDGDYLGKGIISGTNLMIENKGSSSNEEVFWEYMVDYSKLDRQKIEELLMGFYLTRYNNIKKVLNYQSISVEIIKILKDKGYKLYLTTNPLFPKIGTQSRMMWNDLNPNDFEVITTYENSHYCKPNLKYYQEVMDKFNLQADSILMVGNDVKEDLAIEKLGVLCFLVTDQLFNSQNIEYTNTYQVGSREKLLEFVKNLPTLL